MDKYVRMFVTVRGYVYDPEKGDPTQGISPGKDLRTYLTDGFVHNVE